MSAKTDAILARARCIHDSARYEHEHRYADGMEIAAQLLGAPGQGPSALSTMIGSEADPEVRRGMRKALLMWEFGSTDEWGVLPWLERMDTTLAAIEVRLAALEMSVRSRSLRLPDRPLRSEHEQQ